MPGSHYHQQRFWNLLISIRVHLDYVNLYSQSSYKWDNGLKIYLAIASAGSIAGWAVWQSIQIVWAIIIAGSQVVIAISPHLPYRKRLDMLLPLATELHELLLNAEHAWYYISEGHMTNDEIAEAILDIRRRDSVLDTKYLSKTALPYKNKRLEKAEALAGSYFRQSYSLGEHDE